MAIEHEGLDRVLYSAVQALPALILASLGWLALQLTKDDPSMNTVKYIGGTMLAGFVGWVACIFLLNSGLHPDLAAALASVIGSSGMKGYEWLLEKAKTKE